MTVSVVAAAFVIARAAVGRPKREGSGQKRQFSGTPRVRRRAPSWRGRIGRSGFRFRNRPGARSRHSQFSECDKAEKRRLRKLFLRGAIQRRGQGGGLGGFARRTRGGLLLHGALMAGVPGAQFPGAPAVVVLLQNGVPRRAQRLRQ